MPATPLPQSIAISHRARELHVADDALDVGIEDVCRASACRLPDAKSPASIRWRRSWISSPDSVLPRDHHLQAVVVGRIVAAGHA